MNDIWKDYWYKVNHSPIEKLIEWYKIHYGYRKLLSVLTTQSTGTSLEVGAGKAYLSKLLLKKGWAASTLDSEDGCDYTGNAIHLLFDDKSFDLVFSCGLVEHFTQIEAILHVEEMHRVGKRVVCFFPIADWKWNLIWKIRKVPMANNFFVPDGTVNFIFGFKYGYITL